ncbi:hypothetical protein Q765_00370 [Flavobacterium rivuli WB 3.3-2 = DSM 21788]|uniref:Uncharacterized protein n=1 Tax=Flavobacterium rivuli WB 3.3-2 = DSM 21788 TaxID=1121895 RepID=A0A0A2M9T2_9FLAO|nr:hypothetical protein [Flavobacterium rivuli]KGO88406.1 hypothetical protein Q765_00370 [Flavobacterium rivuli WB 3.3-2 = DSM 21788]
MNIDLKLTPDEIGYLNNVLSDAANVDVATFARSERQNKVVISILAGVSETVEDKFKALSRKQNLFDAKKKYKLSLQYHEAYAINIIVCGRTTKERDPHRRLMANKLFTTIDAKL